MRFNPNKLGHKVLSFVLRFLVGFLITAGTVLSARYLSSIYFSGFTEPTIIVPIKVTTPEVEVGNRLGLELTFRKPDEVFVSSVRQIRCLDGTIVLLDESTAQLPVTDGFETVQISIPVPDVPQFTGDQQCVYEVRGEGQVNDFKTYRVKLVSEDFRVIR